MIPGRDGRTVEALCWAGGRLFSTGLNGEIVEYDLENLRTKYTVEAYGGPVWTISSNSQGTHLAVSHVYNARFVLASAKCNAESMSHVVIALLSLVFRLVVMTAL